METFYQKIEKNRKSKAEIFSKGEEQIMEKYKEYVQDFLSSSNLRDCDKNVKSTTNKRNKDTGQGINLLHRDYNQACEEKNSSL